MKFLKEHSVFICILVTCAALRFLPLFDYQFTYDELSGLERTQFDSFSEVIEKGVKIDAHPALIQLLIFYLTKIFGYTAWIIKLPFLLFGCGAVIYSYAFGLRNFSKQAGLFAAAIFSFSLLFVFYAPIARMYISGVFFSAGLLFYFFEIFFLKSQKFSHYFLLGLFALLSALNQHINALFAFTLCASGFLFLNKINYKPYLLMCLAVILAYLPHLPVTLYQLSVPGIGVENGGWLEAPEFSVLFSFLKALLGTGKVYLLLLIILLLALVLNKSIPLTKARMLLILLFIFNFLVVYVYSVWRTPIFQYSVMLFSGTALIFFLCSFISFQNRLIFHVTLLALTTALVYKTYIKKDYLHQCVKTVYDYQFERTVYYKKLYGDKNVFPVFFDADEIMKKIYFEKYAASFECRISADPIISNMERKYYSRDKDPVTGEAMPEGRVSSLRLFSEFISGLKSDYLVLSSAMPQHQAIVKERFPFLIENTQTQAINYKVYSRKKTDKGKVLNDDAVDSYSSPAQRGDFTYSLPLNPAGTPILLLKADSLAEFPMDAKAGLFTVTEREGQVVLVKAKVKLRQRNSPLEACISVTDAESNASYFYNAKAASDFVMTKDSVLTLYSEHFNGVKYDQVKYRSNITCYLWNRGREHFELLDFEIKVIDYWPRKWDLWD